MKEPIESTASTQHLRVMVTEDGCPTLWNEEIQQSYRSYRGALLESLQVFLIHSGAAEHLEENRVPCSEEPFRCLEVGFGTGLNFLLLASCAMATQRPVRYLGLESNVLPPAVLGALRLDEAVIAARTNQELPWQSSAAPSEIRQPLSPERWSLAEMLARFPADCLRSVWRAICKASHGYHAASRSPTSLTIEVDPCIEAGLIVGPAEWTLFDPALQGGWDAIFFDPFSPQVAPSLWATEMFERLHNLLRSDGRLVTYCVASEIRRRLSLVGFVVKRVPGPIGGKRQVLIAIRP